MGSVCLLLLLGAVCTTARSAELLRQDAQNKTVREGEEVTFSCSLEGEEMSKYWMYWYRKGEQGTLTWIYREGDRYGDGFQGRFEGETDSSENRFTLRLLQATRADRAVYYCAARERGYGDIRNELIFGSGTRLQVEPKSDPTPPSVLLMKSKATSGKQVKAACLAKDFYPKEVKMNFVNSSVVYEQDDPVLSQNGKYNTIKVVQINDTEDVACSVDHQGKQYSAKAAKPAAEQPMTMPTTFCAPSNSTAAEENPEKVNMLAMTVLGLRVLFAKTIAFNTLMTIKLFVF